MRKGWKGLKRWSRKFIEKVNRVESRLQGLYTEKFDFTRMSPVQFARDVLDVKPFPYQARLLEDSSKRIVACMGRQSGKTHTIAMRAIHFAYSRPSVTVLITSPSMRQSMIMFDRISFFIFTTPELKRKVVRSTRTVIQLDNQSQIIALPCSENLLRGYTAHLIICDEAAFMPEETIVNVIFPMISTTDGYAILLSTPWGKDHFFYRAFMNPDYSVHRVKSSECPLISEKFLEEMQKTMTAEAYQREYEAEFSEAARSYFPQNLIRSCVDPELELNHDLEVLSPQRGEFYGGCDLGKLADYSVFVVVEKVRDTLKLRFLHEFPLETPYSNVIGFIVRANEKFRFRKIFVDKGGVGEPVTEEISSQGLMNTEGKTFTVQSKGEMLGFLRIKMEQGLFKMPYDRRLCSQINEQRYEYTKSGQLKFWHPTGSHDDQLWALALACFAVKETEPTGDLVRAY